MATNYTNEKVEVFPGRVRNIQRRSHIDQENSGEIDPLLIDELNGLEDFVRNSPDDRIFEEYESLFPPATPLKSCRPTVLKSVFSSVLTVLQLVICGILIAVFGVLLFYVTINTTGYCHWVPLDQLVRMQARVRLVGASVQGFLIQFWQFSILWTIFKWPLLKELNLLPITLLGAFVDITYRSLLHIFDAYDNGWISYPLDGLFLAVTLYNSYAIGSKMFPTMPIEAWKLTLKLCAQILSGMPVVLFSNNLVFEWFAKTPRGYVHAILALFMPMIILPSKIITRLCAIHLEGINHPGTSHALVASLYGAVSIVSRTLQASIESTALFVGLSIAHGVFHIVERLTVPLRDYFWNRLALSLCCCCGCRRRHEYNVRSPRTQRLIADMSIQGMLFETTSIVYSISVLYVYYAVYGEKGNRWMVLRKEITSRIPVALAVDLVFNVISVVFQTRYMNIPVMRVWKRNWKKHLTLAMITTTITVCYFTQYQLQLIRAEYLKTNGTYPVMKNCTKPFMLH